MTKYHFDFLSNYDGESQFRLYIDGSDYGRISVFRDRRMAYTNNPRLPVLPPLVTAFNAARRAEHAKALAKHGAEHVGPFAEYWA